MHFSQNVIFGVPGQNISVTAGPNCMIFSELTDMNEVCALNNLDFHLATGCHVNKSTKFLVCSRSFDMGNLFID